MAGQKRGGDGGGGELRRGEEGGRNKKYCMQKLHQSSVYEISLMVSINGLL